MASITSLGVGSNLDLSGLLDQLAKAESAPVTALQKKQVSFNAKLTAYARLQGALDAALAQATHDIATQAMAQGLKGPAVGRRIHAARVRAIEQALATVPPG